MELLSNPDFLAKYGTTRLNDIQVIGTHDSACYQLICGNTNNKLVKILNPLRYIFPCVNSILKQWTLTQDKCILEQLRMGIRTLDLRVVYDPKKQQYYFTHTFYCVSALTVLKHIGDYLDSDRTAFVIVTIRHDSEHQTYTDERNTEFKQLVVSMLGSRAIPKPEDVTMYPTLDSVLENNQQLIIGFMDDQDDPGNRMIWGNRYFNGRWVQDTDDDAFYGNAMEFIRYQHNPLAINHIPLVKTPTVDIVKQDIKGRFLKCGYKPQSVRSWSAFGPNVYKRLKASSVESGFDIKTNIFWLDYV